jgi:hypothetical protein
MYKYQIEGRWRTDFVSKKEIRNLLIKGSLTPYCFIQDSGVGSQKSMICKHPDFEASAHTDWAKLRKVRSLFNQLWKGQLDAIMSGIVQRVGHSQSSNPEGGEQIIQNLRMQIEDGDILDLIDHFCRQEDANGVMDNEIFRRTTNGFPKIIDDLPFSKCGETLDNEVYQQKKAAVLEWVNNENLRNYHKLVYAFKSATEVLYVGKTENIWIRFSQDHFVSDIDGTNGRRFCHECKSIEVYNVKGNIDGDHRVSNFESLMIYRHGTPDNDNRPRYNATGGVNLSRGPIYKLHHFISKEVDELKS